MNQEFEIDLKDLTRHLLKRIWISIVCAILLGALFLSNAMFFTAPKYTSQATLYVINRQSGSLSSAELMGFESLLNDYIYIISSRAVLEPVIAESGCNISYQDLLNSLSLSHKLDTRIIRVSVTRSDPAEATKLVNLICNETQSYITDMMKSDQIKVIDYGSNPRSPSSPNLKKSLVLGLLIGFVIPMIVNFVLFMTVDKINTAEDVEKRLGMNIIGRIPYSAQLDKKFGQPKRRK